MKLKKAKVYSNGFGMFEPKENAIYYDKDLDNFKHLKKFVIEHEKGHAENQYLWYHIKHDFLDKPKLIFNKNLRKEIRKLEEYKLKKTLCEKWKKGDIVIYNIFNGVIFPIILLPIILYSLFLDAFNL